ncbi:MAG: hypothetical protein L0287_02360, partial [Anaerolineae bacterium]|nr:hypothetical protein [Anaerolineae bacterium]
MIETGFVTFAAGAKVQGDPAAELSIGVMMFGGEPGQVEKEIMTYHHRLLIPINCWIENQPHELFCGGEEGNPMIAAIVME